MANLAELAALLGLGGLVGVITGLALAGKKFAEHLSKLISTIEQVLRDPRHSDLAALIDQAKLVEKDAQSVLGMLRQVFKS